MCFLPICKQPETWSAFRSTTQEGKINALICDALTFPSQATRILTCISLDNTRGENKHIDSWCAFFPFPSNSRPEINFAQQHKRGKETHWYLMCFLSLPRQPEARSAFRSTTQEGKIHARICDALSFPFQATRDLKCTSLNNTRGEKKRVDIWCAFFPFPSKPRPEMHFAQQHKRGKEAHRY